MPWAFAYEPLLLVAGAWLLLAGCNSSEPRGPTRDLDARAPESDGGSTPSPSGTTTGGACTTDADCRTAASYCADAPCVCRPLAKGEAEPRCAGAPVSCFADPCMRKAAACQAGRCELVIGP